MATRRTREIGIGMMRCVTRQHIFRSDIRRRDAYLAIGGGLGRVLQYLLLQIPEALCIRPSEGFNADQLLVLLS